MAALPLPVAILDDLICGNRKWGHPRWRPEAEGPPFSSASAIGVEKSTPSPYWCHFRRRHLESKMAGPQVTSVGRLHERLDVLQTSFPPPPSWIQDGGAGNDINQDLGYFFRSPLWRWRKMAALPLPAAILDDLISGSRKWGHPRWRPEAEGPPFCATATTGIEKSTPSPGWCHFRRRHLGFKMAAVEMTSGGRRDAREDVLQTSAPSMSPVEVWLYFLVRLKKKIKSIWSLASPRHYPSDWVSCPLTTTRKSTSLHMSKVVKNLRLRQAPTLLFFFWFFFLTVLYNSLELLYSTVS